MSMTTPTEAGSADLVCRLAENSRIKFIGLGGIGCIVLPYLVLFLQSLRRPVRLVLIDGDRFESANSQRMLFPALGNKAEVKAAEAVGWLSNGDVTVVAVPEYVTVANIERLINPGDHVFLSVDNHPTRLLVSDHASRLPEIALFSGGNEGVDPPRERGTYGSVQVHLRRGGQDLTGPLTRHHPEIAKPSGRMPTEADCGQMALTTPQILFTNLAVASALLNAFFAYACGRLTYQEVKLDILEARMLPQFPFVPDELPHPLPLSM